MHGTIAKLHVVTPPGVDGRDLVTTQALLRAGAPLVQVRTKGVDDRARLEVAAVVVDAARASGFGHVPRERPGRHRAGRRG